MAVTKVSSSTQFVTRASAMGGRDAAASGHWVPNTDVYSTDAGLVIKVELAGMRSENLEIIVEGNRLRISGDRPDTCRAPKASFLVMEINYGPFESILELPYGYDLGQAKASYLNGFLRIEVPPVTPAAHQKSTKLPITDGQ
ncbi:MAG: Hsp20/alpha crystallin family protein [Verrucomicrobia bacterium]|jgi:HSP20 family protein|nr:MAG: Hsp20/alpha crystallin family protein [Verrucomicrobiota bacterium]